MTLPTTHTLKEVAASLRVHPRTLLRAIERSGVALPKIGSRLRLRLCGKSHNLGFAPIFPLTRLGLKPNVWLSGRDGRTGEKDRDNVRNHRRRRNLYHHSGH